MKGFSKDLVLGWTAQAIHSKKIVICSNSLDYMIEENCHLFERLVLCIQNNIIVSHTIVPNHLHPEPFAMNLSKTVRLNDSSKRCLPSSHEFSQYIFCWIAFFAFTTLDYHYRLSSGAPNDNFQKTICSEDDLRSRIFRTFVVKFLACLLLLVFSNI